MQQENVKKGKKLGWLIAGLAVLLVIVGVVLALILMPGEQASKEPTGPVGGRPQLYWNIDRQKYLGDDNSAGLSKREPGEDGLYHLLFAFDGKQVEYAIADKRLVNVIDTYDVIGLVFDDAGNVIDAVDPTTIATEVAKGFFVMRSQETRLEMNSSYLMNGMAQILKLTDLAEVYNVSDSAETVGMVDTLQALDKVLIYANDKEEVTHIYIVERQPEAEVYWRADRKYDATAAATSRTPDENGVYTILFAYKGKQVELKCKDKDIVSKIDKPMIYAAPFGLLFDEEGYIIGTVDAAIALRGKLLGSGFNITAIDGDTYTATYLQSGAQNGEEITFTLGENTEVYNCCIGGTNEFIGEATQLQMMDRVMVYTDMDGNPLIVFVMYRMVDSPIYYNIERKYNDTTQETTRVPDENGYYVFQMAVNGKQVTLKTRNKDIASKVDSFAYKMMGLKVNGNIIEKVYTPYVVCGSDVMSPGTERFVVGQTGVILSFAAQGTSLDLPTNMVMTTATEVVDVSGYPGTKIGEKTTVREGDKIRVLQDVYGNLTHIYITERYTGYPIYYNYSRYYSATAGTTRTPDAEGYYVYEMASKGKQVTVKTKDKTLADYIDLQNPNIVALKVNKSGIVTAAAPAQSSIKYGRRAAANGLYLNTTDGNLNFTLASTGKTYSTPVASNPTVYNCGTVYDNFRGEKTKLQKDDQMVAIRDDKLQQVVEIYVIERKLDCELYYNCKPMYNSVTKETTRTPDAEGWYIFDLAVAGKVKQFKTKDKEIANYIDSRGVSASPFAAVVNGDVIKRAMAVTAKRGLRAFAVSNYDFMDAGDGKCVLKCFVSTNAGKTLEAKLASNYKAYDVSAYAENFGAQVKLKVGDRVICYYNDKYEIEWFYIWYRSAREDGAWSKCSHCNKTVYWMPYSATDYTQDAHVYLTHDHSNVQSLIGIYDGKAEDQPEIVLDLNGHTLKTAASADRLFVVYGNLSIMDSVGGGKIVARSNNKATGCGAIMVQQPGTLKLYSGTLAGSGADTKITNGGVVFVGAGSTFTMYGGTITGGKANNGGNVFNQYGTFNMYGGTITDGTANVGGNVYLGSGTFVMGAGTIDGDVVTTDAAGKVTIVGKSVIGKGKVTGLQLVSGITLPLSDKVTADTKITVDATGVFTNVVDNPNSYLGSFTGYDPAFPVGVKGGALTCGIVAKCEECKEDVYWTRFSAAACAGEAHLVLTEDMTLDIPAFIPKNSNIVVDLNGHTLSTKGDRTFNVEGGTLSIQDSVGGGKVVGRTNSNTGAAGTVLLYSSGKMNLYSGTLAGSGADTKISNGGIVSVGAGSTFNMYGGTITGGKANNGGNIHNNGTAVIHNGTVEAGAATNGGNIYGGGTVTINNGTITGGTATNGGNIYSTSTVIINNGAVETGVAQLGGNIYSTSAVRMNNGTISGGKATNGGNIYSTAAVNLQGGTVENGEATPVVTYDAETPSTTAADGKGGNIYAENAVIIVGSTDAASAVTATVTGGKAYQGGNIYTAKITSDDRALTVNVKGVVTNGEAVIADDGQDHTVANNFGGNIYSEKPVTIAGGTVSNGKATNGGNIYAAVGAVDLQGGTVENGEATPVVTMNGTAATVTEGTGLGGNIYADFAAVTVGATSGDVTATVTGGKAYRGGNIYSAKVGTNANKAVTINAKGVVTLGEAVAVEGDAAPYTKNIGGNLYNANTTTIFGTVTDGKADDGGNIYAMNWAGLYGASISGGKAVRRGGNIFSNGTLEIDSGVIENGEAVNGGNIAAVNNVNVQANATVQNGTATDKGGNIYMIITGSDRKTLTVKGKVLGGTAPHGAGIAATNMTKIVVNGGEITGAMQPNDANVQITVSGAAKISNLILPEGCKITMDRLSDGAGITVSATGVFTNESDDAATYQAYFEPAANITLVGNTLSMG